VSSTRKEPTHGEYDDDESYTTDGSWHVVPAGDTREHSFTEDPPCWCDPYYDEASGYHIHHSADGREAYEEGWRKPH
jgi:hypothetical protein